MQLKKVFKSDKFQVTFKYSLIKYVALLLGFLKGIINARVLGPELLGMVGNLLLVLNYLSYCNLGILYSMNREYALYKLRDENKAKETLNTTFTFISIISILFIIFGFLIKLFIYKNITGDYIFIILLVGVFEQYRMYYTNYFRLIDKFRNINDIELINNIVTFIIVILFINRFEVYAILYSMLIADIWVFIYGIKNSERLKFRLKFNFLKDLLIMGIPLLIYNLGFYILTTVDRLVIIKYLTYRDLGYYTFSNQIVSATLVFISSVLFLYYPKAIKELNIKEGYNKKNIYNKVQEYTKYIEILGSFLCAASFILMKPFVDIILPQYENSIMLFRVLVIGAVATQLSYFANVFIVSNKKQIYLIYLQLFTIVFAVIFNYIFIKLGLGINGVAIATLLCNLFYSFMQHAIFLRILKYKNKVNVFLLYKKFLFYICVLLFLSYIKINFTLYTLLIIIVTVIIYKSNLYKILS